MGSVGETLGDIGYLHDHKKKTIFPKGWGFKNVYILGVGGKLGRC